MVTAGCVLYSADGDRFSVVVVLAWGSKGYDVAVLTHDAKRADYGICFPSTVATIEEVKKSHLPGECSMEDFAEKLESSARLTIEQLFKNALGKSETFLQHTRGELAAIAAAAVLER